MGKIQLSTNIYLNDLLVTNTGLSFGDLHYLIVKNLYYIAENVIEPLYTKYGKDKVRITSGYRTKEINEKVGGEPNSFHLMGEAVDIVIDTKEKPSFTYDWILTNIYPTYLKYYKDKGHFHISYVTPKSAYKNQHIIN